MDTDVLVVGAGPTGLMLANQLARARIAQASFYLLGPDGYVGLCGARLDAAAVSGYAERRLRLAERLDLNA